MNTPDEVYEAFLEAEEKGDGIVYISDEAREEYERRKKK